MILNIIFFMFRLCLSKFILTCTDAGDDTTVDEQIGACDKTGMLTQQEGCCLGNLVAGTCTLGGRGIYHALVALIIGIELVVGQRGNDNSRRDGIDTCTTFAP